MSSSSLNQPSDLALVRSFVESFCTAFNRKDAAALGPLFSDDIDFVTIFGARAVGREAVLKMHDQLFTTGLLVGSEVSAGEMDCNRVAPTILVAHAAWTRSAGKQMPAGTGLFTLVMRDTGAGKAEVVALSNVENRKPGPPPNAAAAGAGAPAK